MRQIVLDTETTGLEPEQGHRVIELGAVELIDRRLTGKRLQLYMNPEREIDDAAYEVHGISAESLADKPNFREVAEQFLNFIADAEVIIHNAPFDVSFIDYELSLLDNATTRNVAKICSGVTDSLALARRKHPGQKNSLDALCRRYDVDNSARELHGALLDAEILADVYLAMTGGQSSLFGDENGSYADTAAEALMRLPDDRPPILVQAASAKELAAHETYLDSLDNSCAKGALWRRLGSSAAATAQIS